jgi:hypothetical protein
MQLVDSEQLAKIRDEEIFNIQNIFRRKLMKARRERGGDTYIAQLETELNYIYRELDVREGRRRAHLEYIQTRSNRSRNSHNS